MAGITDQRTGHYSLPLPHVDNLLRDDVARLREALGGIDTALHGASTSAQNAEQQIQAHKQTPRAHTKAQVGLDQVDNTSDAEKPISLATAAALALKLDAGHAGIGGDKAAAARDCNALPPVNGGYWMGADMDNGPGPGWWLVQQMAHNDRYLVQLAWSINGERISPRMRRKRGATWEAWQSSGGRGFATLAAAATLDVGMDYLLTAAGPITAQLPALAQPGDSLRVLAADGQLGKGWLTVRCAGASHTIAGPGAASVSAGEPLVCDLPISCITFTMTSTAGRWLVN